MDFITAMESIFCCKCDCMAVATPIEPTIKAIRLIRLRNVVACSRPRVSRGCVSRKSAMTASGKAFFSSALTSSTPAPGVGAGSLKRWRCAARLPWLIKPARCKVSRRTITRGPTFRLPAMRSGSAITTAASFRSSLPRRTVSPILTFKRVSKSSETNTASGVSLSRNVPSERITSP